MAVADYLSRTFDLLAWRGAQLGIDTQVAGTLLDEESDGEICTGIQKAAQRYLIELLTPRASIHFYQNRGCDFLESVLFRSGRLSSDIFAAFAIAEVQIRTNLIADEIDSDPDDERYGSSQLLEVDLQATQLHLKIEYVSRAGTSLTFIAPLPIIP